MHVAILGAGIMGSSLALELSRLGHRVSLFDRLPEPVAAASRWNEGKLHLGYIYAADATLATARSVMPGGLKFRSVVEDLLGIRLDGHTTTGEDIYLVHRDSIVSPSGIADVFRRVDALLRDTAAPDDYFGEPGGLRSRQLSPSELAAISSSDRIVAGLAAPERSVNTRWLAARYADALHDTPGIELRLATEILSATPLEGADGRWQLDTDGGTAGPFDLVVNALWEGRLAVDVTAGLTPAPGWSHRYRYCLFVETREPVATPSALVAVGPFGDVKNYDGRHFYLSWYPVGMVRDGHDLSPPAPPAFDPAGEVAFIADVRRELSGLMQGIDAVFDAAAEIRIHGGYVFAKGRGALDDPTATIHRRDRFGATRRGNYVSVDTGKFSTAPFMARALAREIAPP